MNKLRVVFAVMVLSLFVITGCATEKRLWRDASRMNSITKIDNYLKKYPNGEHAGAAKKLRAYLVEKNIYRLVTRSGTSRRLEDYQRFLKKYPDGHLAGEAKRKILGLDDQAWAQAKRKNTIDAYESFIDLYGFSRHVEAAKQRKANLIEGLAWARARSLDNSEAYAAYLQEYPAGRYANYAKTRREKRLDKETWAIADKQKTIQGYEAYLKKFPNGIFAYTAAREKNKLKEKKLWQKARRARTFKGYSDYLSTYPKGKNAEAARKEIPKFYLLSDAEINKIAKWQKEGSKKAKSLSNVEKLIFTGANFLDKNASWTNRSSGRKIYDLLKRYNPTLLSKAMTRAVLIQVNRLHVLFLVVKLGISGTEKSLNDLLLKYGDKSMAEDYLNSGSKKLHKGGAAWARANGYGIMTGWGSSRVGWGNF